MKIEVADLWEGLAMETLKFSPLVYWCFRHSGVCGLCLFVRRKVLRPIRKALFGLNPWE